MPGMKAFTKETTEKLLREANEWGLDSYLLEFITFDDGIPIKLHFKEVYVEKLAELRKLDKRRKTCLKCNRRLTSETKDQD